MKFDWAWSWTRYQVGVEWCCHDEGKGYISAYVVGLRLTWFWG